MSRKLVFIQIGAIVVLSILLLFQTVRANNAENDVKFWKESTERNRALLKKTYGVASDCVMMLYQERGLNPPVYQPFPDEEIKPERQ